jgi:hypothetical protein
MKTAANIALGLFIGGVVAWTVIHRHAISACVKGEPIPEPPAWHFGHGALK